MTTVETPLIETLIENLIETSLRLQGSLKDGVPEGIDGDVLKCGELLDEIRQQASMAELIVSSKGRLKSRLGYLREILDTNYAVIRQKTTFGDFMLRARTGAAPAGVYAGDGKAGDRPQGGTLLDTRG